MRAYTFLLILFASLQLKAAAFRNLDFEEANTDSLTPIPAAPAFSIGPAEDLLPGWQLFRGTNQLSLVGYNLTELWGPFGLTGGVTIATSPFQPIQGKFTLSFSMTGVNPDPFTLVQRADIPLDAKVLVFTYRYKPFVASINGVDVSPQVQQIGRPSTTIADISMFAGQNVELSFRTSGSASFDDPFGVHDLDSIGFVVPEPSSIALLAVGFLVFIGRRVFWDLREGKWRERRGHARWRV